MAKETGLWTADGFADGSKAYQRHARAALPILVRQAIAHTPITYSALAQELKIATPEFLVLFWEQSVMK